MEEIDCSREGHIQLLTEYGSQYGQIQVTVMEVNGLQLPAVKRLGISHIYVKSHLLNGETRKGFFLPSESKETKRKTEEEKLTTYSSERENVDSCVTSRKVKIRNAFKKQRERFRFRRTSDKVKTLVNSTGERDNGRATLYFERVLFYPTVSLYQLQTQSLHLTVCGRNVKTTRSFPIATMCTPLMVAIKQHQPTWYQLSYNPDLIPVQQGSTLFTVQESWEMNEVSTYQGRSAAWDGKENNLATSDNWLHKRKDYSRHLHNKNRKQPTAKTSSSRAANTSGHDRLRRPSDETRHQVRVDRLGRQSSIEELYFDEGTSTDDFQSTKFRIPQKQWKSEFVICAATVDGQRTSNGTEFDHSLLSRNGSLNRKTFGESIRGF